MSRRFLSAVFTAAALSIGSSLCVAQTTMPETAVTHTPPAAMPSKAGGQQALYDRVTPSLVAVKFSFAGEVEQADLTVAGIVVSDKGLVMIPLDAVNEQLPDVQLTKFKIIVPSGGC